MYQFNCSAKCHTDSISHFLSPTNMSPLKPAHVRLLATGNLTIALIALLHDLPALRVVPFALWPVIAICPVYPLVLAAYWNPDEKERNKRTGLTAFAGLPAAVFGLLALVFYPLIMARYGFDWANFGQIFWVWLYAAQGWYLVFQARIQAQDVVLAGAWLFLVLITLYQTQSFGYLALDLLTQTERFIVLQTGFAATVVTAIVWLRRGKD